MSIRSELEVSPKVGILEGESIIKKGSNWFSKILYKLIAYGLWALNVLKDDRWSYIKRDSRGFG